MLKAGLRRDTEQLSELVHQIYDAGVNPERWTAVVTAIAASLGASKGLLFTPYLAPQHGGIVFPAGISEATLQLWGSSYIDHDIWAQDLQRKDLWRTGESLLDEQITPWDEFLPSRFYREFLSTIGIGRVCVGLVFGGNPGLHTTTLPIFRDIHDPPFNQDDAAWMKLLVSHVSRSLGVMHRLELAHMQQTSLLASFDRLAFGVVLLDQGMRVVHMNQAADTVFRRKDGLSITDEKYLESSVSAVHAPRLSRWLTALSKTPASRQVHFLDGCVIPRKNSQRHYIVQCSEIGEHAAWRAGGSVRYVAFIVDPAAIQLPAPERLMQIYGLTPTQARVTLAFAHGGTYIQVAHALGISEETVRSHVKEIYCKTRVHRQADLVHLVLSLAQSAV